MPTTTEGSHPSPQPEQVAAGATPGTPEPVQARTVRSAGGAP